MYIVYSGWSSRPVHKQRSDEEEEFTEDKINLISLAHTYEGLLEVSNVDPTVLRNEIVERNLDALYSKLMVHEITMYISSDGSVYYSLDRGWVFHWDQRYID